MERVPSITAESSGRTLLQESDVIEFMKSTSGPVTVKLVVSAVKNIMQKDARNKERLRDVLKKVLNLEKGIVTLKDEYK
jgi:hypothetical protein